MSQSEASRSEARGPEPIGRVSPEERDLILALHQRKLGLCELFASVSRLDDELKASRLFERMVSDMGEVAVDYDRWWDAMAEKYGWPRQPGRGWRIDFETCSVYLE